KVVFPNRERCVPRNKSGNRSLTSRRPLLRNGKNPIARPQWKRIRCATKEMKRKTPPNLLPLFSDTPQEGGRIPRAGHLGSFRAIMVPQKLHALLLTFVTCRSCLTV